MKSCTIRTPLAVGSLLVFLVSASFTLAVEPTELSTSDYTLDDIDDAALVAVAMDESNLYLVGDDATLIVVDYLLSPPEVQSTFAFQHQPDQIVFQQHLLAAAEGEFGVELVDIAEPASPQMVGMISTVDGYPEFEADGICFGETNQVLVASGDNVHLFDVTNPAEIEHLGVHLGERTARDLSVDGSLLAVGNRGFGFETVDISDPANPQHVAQSSDRADQVTLLGTHAFTAAEEFEAAVMRVIDVDPELAEPAVLGDHETYAGYDGEFTIPELVTTEDGAVAVFPYMWEHGDGSVGFGAFVYDTSQPSAPDKVAQINLPAEPTGASLSGTTFAVTYGIQVGLFDLTNPANPVELAGYSTSVEDSGVDVSLPQTPSIESVYPNPFNASTRIVFSLPQNQRAQLALFDVLGRQRLVLADYVLSAGRHEVTLNTRSLGSGTYFIRIESNKHQDSKKLIILK